MTLWQDIRYALRVLRNSPSFAIVALLTLALGIGMNTAIFSVVNGVLLEPLPFPDSERIVAVHTRWKHTGRETPRLTGGDLIDIRADQQVFEGFSYYVGGEVGVQLRDRAEFTGAYFVNADFFRIFGLKPMVGRLFTDDAADRSAVVSLPFAQRNFGDGTAALGQSIRVDNQPYEIVGILPAAVFFPRQSEVWMPALFKPDNLNRTSYNYATLAKLKPGITVDAAKSQLDAIGSRLEGAFPDSNRNKTFSATPLRDRMVGQIRETLYLLMGAVALVLLIACANVSNLLLARATARSREMAVRAALGAGRARIVRQLVIESGVLALAGGVLGFLLAQFGTRLLIGFAPQNLPRLNEVRVDWFVLLFATAASLLATFLFGLAPAWHASRVDLNDALKQGATRGSVGGRSNRLRGALVVAEVALSFVLAIGAGLLLRSFVEMSHVQLGYRTEGILVMYAHTPARSLDEARGATRFFENLFPQLAALPGVTSVAGAMGLPTGSYGSNGYYIVEGKHTWANLQSLPHAGFRLASPGYFATMGVPLIAGREFSARDQYDAPFVAIVSKALVKQTFPNEDPIGKRIQCGLDSPNWMTIVGVVGDVRADSPASPPGPELYMPFQQHPHFANELQVALRTAVEPASLANAVRQKVRDANPEVATKFTTMQTMVAESIAAPRFRTMVVGLFAALALLLAMAGIYAVVSYQVVQRTQEIGLRVALGAAPGGVVKLILTRGLMLTGVGLVLGVGLSIASGRVMATMLFGLKPLDAMTYASVIVAITVVAVAAAAIPAWRAARIDPLVALREE